MTTTTLILLSGLLLLAGCSTSFTGETRGFTYKLHDLGEFVCTQTPMQVEVTLDEAIVQAASIMEATTDPANGETSAPTFPSAQELVTYCQQLQNNVEIKF